MTIISYNMPQFCEYRMRPGRKRLLRLVRRAVLGLCIPALAVASYYHSALRILRGKKENP